MEVRQMRKAWIIAAITVLIAALLALPVCAEEIAEEVAEPAWWAVWESIDVEGLKAWFEVEVMPHLASVSIILGVAMVEIIPAVRGLLKAKAAFTKVAGDVDKYNQNKIEYDLRMEEQIKKLNKTVAKYEKALAESEARLAAILTHLDKSADKVEKMVYVGLTNSVELVSNGAAKRIAAIEAGEDEDAEDVETEEYSDGEE